jgi:hypothetical protein
MGPRCSSAETQVCHRSYIIAARGRYRKWRHRKRPDRKWSRAHAQPALFFITIVVVQNASLRMTDLGTGCDVTPKGLPWKGVRIRNRKLRNIRPEVPLGCSLGRPRPIYHFLPLSLVNCPFTAIRGAPSIITKVCCFRIGSICSPSSLSRPPLWGY